MLLMAIITLLLLLIYPVISILPFLVIWCYKFGSPLLATGMFIVWIVLIFIVIRLMGRSKT